ncbi:Transcription factor spt20 [Borealophlyctis nickersoniae]|nr:Transcription factor spt20 [Borealophlyctis nickersoniae]
MNEKGFLEAVNRQELPAEAADLFKESDFHDGTLMLKLDDFESHSSTTMPAGCVHVDVHDHRVMFQHFASGDSEPRQRMTQKPLGIAHTRRLLLKPNPNTIWSDLSGLNSDLAANGTALTEDFALDVEAKLLPVMEPSICLDPDPVVAHASNVIAYNDAKYRIPKKRPRDWVEKEEQVAKRRESNKLMLIMDERRSREFHPTFSMYSFVEDWRKKKEKADQEVMPGWGDKKKGRRNSLSNVHLNPPNRKIVRTLRFQQEFQLTGVTTYTMLNIYSAERGMYEAVLRTGTNEGTGTSKGAFRGYTHRFPLGNEHATYLYIGEYKGFLQNICHISNLTDQIPEKQPGAAVNQQQFAQSPQMTQGQVPGTPQGAEVERPPGVEVGGRAKVVEEEG